MAIVRVAMIPSLLTLGNFTCGFVAMVLCLHAVRDHERARALERFLPATAAEADVNAPTPATASTAVSPSAVAAAAGENAGAGAAAASEADGAGVAADAPITPEMRRAARLRREISGLSERSGDLFTIACLLVFLGMFFDTLDGRVARMTHTDSKFGAELDSLADASTFGLAPAALLATVWVFVMPEGKSWWGQVMIFGAGYAACAALRLARYNVEIGSTDRNYFRGLPSPGAAGCVASTILLLRQEGVLDGLWALLARWTGGRMSADETQVRVLAAYTLLIGFLMVTRLTFIHVPNKYLSGRRKFTSLVLCVFLIVAMVIWPAAMLCLAFNGYVVWCILHDLWRRGGRRRERENAALALAAGDGTDDNA